MGRTVLTGLEQIRGRVLLKSISMSKERRIDNESCSTVYDR